MAGGVKSAVPCDTAVLLSIRPRYAELIMSSRKRTEFRRVAFSRAISHAVLYASSPTSMVLGYFEVARLDRDLPANLWRIHGITSGVSRDEFASYFGKTPLGVAIRIGRVWRLRSPLALRALGITAPPQSFLYLSEAPFAVVKGQCCDECAG
jgi:predicted transcriptional regulator